MKHTDGPDCPLCNFKLTQAHPTLQDWFKTVVKPEFPDAHISWSWRGKMDQNTFFREGYSGVEFPKSKHNKMDVQGRACSEALDLFRQVAGKYVCEVSDMKKIAAHSEKCGWDDRIQWGITVKGEHKDQDHWQLIVSKTGMNRG